MQGTLDRWMSKIKKDNKPVKINFINEISLMFTRILLTCAIGESLDGVEIDWVEDGKVTKKDVPFVLRQSFTNCLNRITNPLFLLFPSLITYYCFS